MSSVDKQTNGLHTVLTVIIVHIIFWSLLLLQFVVIAVCCCCSQFLLPKLFTQTHTLSLYSLSLKNTHIRIRIRTHTGTIEKDTAEAIQTLISEKGSKWMDLRGQKFVLIGAGSAMGSVIVFQTLTWCFVCFFCFLWVCFTCGFVVLWTDVWMFFVCTL